MVPEMRMPAQRVGGDRIGMISVVIPAYDEEESLRPLTAEVLEVMRGMGREFEIRSRAG